MNEMKITIRKTSELNSFEYDVLIALKQQYWPCDKEMQFQWLNENINPGDIILKLLGQTACLS